MLAGSLWQMQHAMKHSPKPVSTAGGSTQLRHMLAVADSLRHHVCAARQLLQAVVRARCCRLQFATSPGVGPDLAAAHILKVTSCLHGHKIWTQAAEGSCLVWQKQMRTRAPSGGWTI